MQPMLAKKYEDYKPSSQGFSKGLYIQPKLDGIRCLVMWNAQTQKPVALSRNDKALTLTEHLEWELTALFEYHHCQDLVFDGELYLHGQSFQEIMSRVKRVKHSRHPEANLVEYHIYDLAQVDMAYAHRNNRINGLLHNHALNFVSGTQVANVRYVPTYTAMSESELDMHHKTFTSQGYEGSMIRHPHSIYEFGKRSQYLLKRKDFKEEDFKLVNIIEGEGKNKGTAILQLETKAGLKFNVTAPGDYPMKKTIWLCRESIIAQSGGVQVKYQELTDDGIPRFPIALGIKDVNFG